MISLVLKHRVCLKWTNVAPHPHGDSSLTMTAPNVYEC